jgi:hypothetical protein
MICGFSSSPPCVAPALPAVETPGIPDSALPMSVVAPNSGSTKLTAGRLPEAQSLKNCEIGDMFPGLFCTIEPITPVPGRSVK